MRLEEVGYFKNLMMPPGIEPETFLLAQCHPNKSNKEKIKESLLLVYAGLFTVGPIRFLLNQLGNLREMR
jgi:hypothetical protein